MEKPTSPGAVPLRELSGQLQALNARLEYLRLMLKLNRH